MAKSEAEKEQELRLAQAAAHNFAWRIFQLSPEVRVHIDQQEGRVEIVFKGEGADTLTSVKLVHDAIVDIHCWPTHRPVPSPEDAQ